MALAGRLEELATTEILQLLALTRKTGKLHLDTGEREGVLWFRDGRIVFAASDRLRTTLGERLARFEGDRADLARLAGGSGASLTESGALLLPLRGLDVDQVIRAQVETVALELLDWRRGEFVFEPAVLPESGDPGFDPTAIAREGVEYGLT